MVDMLADVFRAFGKVYGGRLTSDGSRDPIECLGIAAIAHEQFRPDPGNQPKILHRGKVTGRSLVLIHGLTDSPFWVEAIARALATHDTDLNIVLPLLPGHGRTAPAEQMAPVRLADWRAIVDHAVDIATMLGREVSIGGFSTGGALSVDKVMRTPELIDGHVLLFSAALNLEIIERIYLTCHLPEWIEAIKGGKTDNDGCGGDPCKYSHMFMCGAGLLAQLISELRREANAGHGFDRYPLHGRTFVAHSEADAVIDISAVSPMIDLADRRQHYILPKALGVSHSSLVLENPRDYVPRFADEQPPPPANPSFREMTACASAFLSPPGT